MTIKIKHFFSIVFSLIIFTGYVAAEDIFKGNIAKDTISVDEVVVTGTRSSATSRNLPMSVSVITESQIEGRMEQSILPVLTEQVPGLFITSRGVMGYGVSTVSAGSISIRGVGGGAQLLMLIDGHPQFMGLMGHPLADSYQSLMAERIEVVRGPASVLYGSNAMGGVVNIITKQEKTDGVKTNLRAMYGSYNTLNAEVSNAVRSGKFSSYASFGYNRTDGHRENMEFEQFSGYAKVGYDFTHNWRSFVDLDITNFESSNPGSISSPLFDNDMNVTRGVTSFSLENNYDRTSGALKFYYNFGYHKINDGYSPSASPRDSRYRSKDDMLGVTMYQNYSFFKGNETTVGVDYMHYGGHAWTKYLNGNPDNDLADLSLNEVAGYVNFQQLFWDKLSFNAGVRFDHHSVTGSEWIPQIGLSYFAGSNTVIKGIVSKGYRNPTIRELYMFGIRNPELDPESIMNYEVSLTRNFLDRRMEFGLNLYYLKGKNSIIYVEGSQGNMWMNTGKLENYGLEVTGRYRVMDNLNVNANYSFIHMKHDIAGTPEHKLYGEINYAVNRWTFTTGLQYIRNLIKEDGKETFALWNARGSFRANKYLDIFARGENLLAQKYEINSGFPMPRATVFGGIALRL